MLLWLYHYPKRNEKNITQQFLVRKTQSRKQVVDATIKSWGKKGFLELIENPDDKRHKFIRLTPLGQSYAQKVILPLEQADTIRYYERIGLVPPITRTASCIRNFQKTDIEALEFVKYFRSAGVSVESLIEYMSLFQKEDSTRQARLEILQDEYDKMHESYHDLG